MKKSATNSKSTISKTEKGLKHLRLAGVGREYIKERLTAMREGEESKISPPETSSNGRKVKK